LNISDRSWVSSRLTPKRVHPVRGSFVLIEYLIPPKNTATAQGEHVFFDIDVKGGEKEWSGLDATVGGPNRLAQSFRVAINAKGGDCWHVYRQVCLSLMARSEYAAMEKQGQRKLRRDSAEVHEECKSVLVYLMETRQARKKLQQQHWRRNNCMERSEA
jgi:hypothetical protein